MQSRAPFAFASLTIFGGTLPNFTRIDDSNIHDHPRLRADDEIYYLFEYTSGKNYSFSTTNQLISNLKKKPSREHLYEYRYKRGAMRDCSGWLSGAINHSWLNGATLVPIPPSKARSDPEYDDRMTQICRNILVPFPLDVRELVVQNASTAAAHESSERLTVEELLEIYEIDETIAAPTSQRIAIVDDVLTAGTHYRAMQILLSGRFSNVPIVGMFIARRVFPEVDLTALFSE